MPNDQNGSICGAGSDTRAVAATAVAPVAHTRDLMRPVSISAPPQARTRTRVVVADPDPIYRAGISFVLQQAKMEVVGSAGTAADLERKARAYHPDLAVVNIEMSRGGTGGDCVDTVCDIRAVDPHIAMVILSERPEQRYALAAADRPQGFGYLLKPRINDVEEFAASVKRVVRGGAAIDPLVIAQLVGRCRDRDPLDDLTERETEVLALIAEGRSNRCIAAELVVTAAAVERHITSIFAKLDLAADPDDHRRVLAVLRYLGR